MSPGREFVDILKDIASSSGIPIVAPILTGIFSTTVKALDHSKTIAAQKANLVETSRQATELYSAVLRVQPDIFEEPSSSPHSLKLRGILRHCKTIEEKHKEYQKRNHKPLLLKKGKRFMLEWSDLVTELQVAVKELLILSSVTTEHHLVAIRNDMRMSAEYDEDNFKLFRQHEYEIVHSPQTRSPSILAARLVTSGEKVIIKRYIKRDKKFQEAIHLLKKYRMTPWTQELLGYSRTGDPFAVLRGGLYTYEEYSQRFHGDQWAIWQLRWRSRCQILSLLRHLRASTENWKFGSHFFKSVNPCLNDDGHIKLDVEYLALLGVAAHNASEGNDAQKYQWLNRIEHNENIGLLYCHAAELWGFNSKMKKITDLADFVLDLFRRPRDPLALDLDPFDLYDYDFAALDADLDPLDDASDSYVNRCQLVVINVDFDSRTRKRTRTCKVGLRKSTHNRASRISAKILSPAWTIHHRMERRLVSEAISMSLRW